MGTAVLEAAPLSLVAFSFGEEGADGFAFGIGRRMKKQFVCASTKIHDLVVDGEVVYVGINFVENKFIVRQQMHSSDDEGELGSQQAVDEDVRHCSFCFVIVHLAVDFKKLLVFLLKAGGIEFDGEIGVLHRQIFSFVV